MALNATEAIFAQEVLGAEGRFRWIFGRIVPALQGHVAHDRRPGRGNGASLKIVKLDVDADPRITAHHNMRAMPTLIIFKHGQPVDLKVGPARAGPNCSNDWRATWPEASATGQARK